MSGTRRAPREERLGRRSRRGRSMLVVNTGYGKSTAAFGIMLRGWARGYRVGVYNGGYCGQKGIAW